MINNNLKSKKISLKVSVVKMVKKDLPFLLKLGKAYWKSANWLTIDYLKSSFNQPGLRYVAKSEDKIVGGVVFVYEDIVKNWIRYLIVDKCCERQGVGGLMLQKIFKRMKSGESVFVDTGASDKKAICFYEKLGFKNRGMVKSLYGNRPAYFFEKIINENKK